MAAAIVRRSADIRRSAAGTAEGGVQGVQLHTLKI